MLPSLISHSCTINLAQGHEFGLRKQVLQALADKPGTEVVQKDARERELQVARPEPPAPRRPRWAEPAGMKLIRVEVEHRRAFIGVNVAQRATEETARQQAKVAATGDGE